MLEEISSDIVISEVKLTKQTVGEVLPEKQELLWGVAESTSASLTDPQRSKLFSTLLYYEDVFAAKDSDLGCTSQLQHHIDTGNSVPVRQPPRRMSPYQQEEVRTLLNDMQKRGIIQPSKSPWASPAYASRSLTKAERRYSVTRQELLAVVTFMHHFRHYLLGKHFVLRTDHSSLKWLQSFKKPQGQFARWLECLQEFNFEVVHHKGQLHNNADSLSRYPETLEAEQERQGSFVGEENLPVLATCEAPPVLTEQSTAEIQELQLADEVLEPLMTAMQANKKTDANSGKQVLCSTTAAVGSIICTRWVIVSKLSRHVRK